MKTVKKAGDRKGRKANHSTLTRDCPTCSGAGKIDDRRVLLLEDELQQIAKDAGISPSHLSKILNNADPNKKANDKRGLTLKVAMRLSSRMGITLDELAALLYAAHPYSSSESLL